MSVRLPPVRGELFLGGEWVSACSGRKLETIDPSTERVLTAVARGGPQDVDDAVGAARAAFCGPCRQVTPAARARRLSELARALEREQDAFALLETLDTGKPLSFARAEIAGCVQYFDYYAGAADKIEGATIPLGTNYLDYTVREPVGVTAHITPWNAPLSMVCRSLAPALAAGNTAVVKPAEQTPLTALKLADLVREVGFPAGSYNVVTGTGDEAGSALSGHPGIDSLTFTGSVATGRAVARAAAEHVKPVVLELGGKSPQVVFADSDLDLAAAEIAKGIYSNAGQYCDAGSRVLVEESVHAPLVHRLVALSRRIRLGPGTDDPDMGPLVSAEHRRRVLGYIEAGLSDGATLVTGGAATDMETGYFVAPTVFDDVRPQMRIAREEIFGPVLSVLPFRSEADAAAIADATEYGLAAGIFTRDLDRALRFARDLQAGYVMVNEYFAGGTGAPFGGYKLSGIGRERGLAALDNYTQVKNVVIRIPER